MITPRKIVLFNVACLLFIILHVTLSAVTGYEMNDVIMLTVCAGFFLSIGFTLFYLNTISKWLTAFLGKGVKLVLSLSVMLIAEVIALCIAVLLTFILLFKLGAKEKASGNGYVIRSEPALEWPPRYVLYKSKWLLEKYIGNIHANEDDFDIQGKIMSVDIQPDSAYVRITNNEKDTVCIFGKR